MSLFSWLFGDDTSKPEPVYKIETPFICVACKAGDHSKHERPEYCDANVYVPLGRNVGNASCSCGWTFPV